MIKKLKISTKMFLLGALMVVGVSIVLTWTYFKYENSIYNEKETQTKYEVETAWNILDYYQKQVDAKKMTLQEAQNAAIEAVKNLSYDGTSGYFWINDMQPRMIMHPTEPQLDGTDLSNVKDPNGKRIFVDIVDVANKSGEGFVNYYWPKKGEDKPVPKISYVKLFPQWNWIIGTGVYVDDVKQEMSGVFYIFLGLILAFLGIILPLYYFIVKKIIVKPVKDITNSAIKIAEGNLLADVSVLETYDEIGDLSRAFKDMHQNLKDIAGFAEKIADGDLSVDINSKSESDTLSIKLHDMAQTIKSLIGDTNTLIKATQEGRLDVRGNAAAYRGAWGELVGGINKMLEAIVEPLNDAGAVLGKMSVNDYTAEIQGQYQGALGQFTDSIKAVRQRLLSLLDVAIKVAKGDISRLEEFHKIGKRSENDKLMPAFTEMMETIQNLINEAGMLANAAVDGNLSVRGNADKFEGGYKTVIEGINKTMDAVVEPIEEASEVLQEMAKGNLTVTMDGDYKGDYAKVKDSLNYTIASFNDILTEFNSAADQVAAGSRHVSDSSQALSQGSSEQASSVEEITAAITQIAAQTKQNAVNANQANELADTAKENAVQGNEQMKEMLIAMHQINESSSNISKIIKVIDEIAFQTNILALNAAVEAARAGQHGKGFAVVAEEVRNLAARSANAAKETTDMIEGSIKKVEAGTSIANHTAEALNVIVENVTKAAAIVSEIAVASNEQATGITQVNQGIAQVSQVTQANTATAEESASASEELSSQAQLLKEMIGRFKLKNSASTSGGYKVSYSEAAAQKDIKQNEARNKGLNAKKVKINLDDKEFGKY